MKVRLKHVRNDALSVEQGKRRIHIYTHRQSIHLSASEGKEQVAFHEFTFDQLHSLLRNLRPGIQDDLP